MKTIFFISCLAFFTSCATRIGVRTPATKFISPEASGKIFNGEITVFNAKGTTASVDLSDNTTGEPLELSDTNDNADFIGGNAEIGILEKMDAIIYTAGNDTPFMAGVKYQVLGEPRLSSSAGNQSLSLVALVGKGTKKDENDDRIELTAEDDEIDTTLNIFNTSASLIYGYRFSEKLLAYAGASYSTMKFEGELESDNNTTLDGEDIDYAGSSNELTVGLIVDLGVSMTLKLEATNQKVDWEKTTAKTFNYVAAGIGFTWD